MSDISNTITVGNLFFKTNGNILFPQGEKHHIANSPFLEVMEKNMATFDEGYQKFLNGLTHTNPSAEV